MLLSGPSNQRSLLPPLFHPPLSLSKLSLYTFSPSIYSHSSQFALQRTVSISSSLSLPPHSNPKMEMKVLIPSPAVDFNFNFDSTSNSPYVSAPSSPQRFGNYFFSAPTSPTRASAFFQQFSGGDTTPSEIPFNWEEKPGVPKRITESETDFAFDFSGQLERPSLSAADELFDGGKIKPLKPPPGLQNSDYPKSPKSPKSPKRMFREAFSPRQKQKQIDPFSAAIEQTRRERLGPELQTEQRGRVRRHDPSNSSMKHKGSRSLSPLRVSDMLFESEINQQNSKQSSSSGSTWYNKWKLKDLLLFRSASEGSTRSGKDASKKYALLKKSESDDVKNSSFRSTESNGSVSGRRKGKGRVSAHELHYTMNRAVSEEMRRKTFLPYKKGLLGCLGFNPSVHEISKGMGIGSSILTRD